MHRPLQPVTSSEAFEMLLLKKECASNRENCNKDCLSCKYYIHSRDELYLINYLIECLKDKEPSLHFCNQLSVLTEILNRRTENDETKN